MHIGVVRCATLELRYSCATTHNTHTHRGLNMDTQAKIQKVMNMEGKSFAFRLAALLAIGTDKGKVWGK